MKTQIDFHISQAIMAAATPDSDGILEGGYTNNSSAIAAVGTIVYYGKISEFLYLPQCFPLIREIL